MLALWHRGVLFLDELPEFGQSALELLRQPLEDGTVTISRMRAAMTQLSLSARAYHRVLKLARTIADLAGVEHIRAEHVAEALQYRPRQAEP